MLRTRILMTACSLALLPGCSLPSQRAYQHPRAHAAGAVTFEIANDRTCDMTVYVVRGSVRQRLGEVGAGQTVRFAAPSEATTWPEMRLIATSMDRSAGLISESMLVWPGQSLMFRLKDNAIVRFPDGAP